MSVDHTLYRAASMNSLVDRLAGKPHILHLNSKLQIADFNSILTVLTAAL